MHSVMSEKLPVQNNVVNVERFAFNDMMQVLFDGNEPHSRIHIHQLMHYA